jgi:hypothetical protein
MKSTKRLVASLLLPAFLFLPAVFYAQTKTNKATVTEGPEVETKRSSVSDICGYDESGYYIVRYQKTTPYLEHINKQMAVDKSVKIPKQKDDNANPLYYSGCSMLNGNLYMFSTSKDSHANTCTFYSQKVTTSSLTFDTPKAIGTATYPNRRGLMHSLAFGVSFFRNISPDESHMLLYNTDMSKDEGDADPTDTKFHMTVFDSEMKKEWEKDVRIPFAPGLFSVEQIKISDKGDIYIIGIEYQEKSEARFSRREGQPTYTYHLYRYSNKGNDVLEMPVDLKGKFITDVQMDGAPNGDIIASGFYSDKGSFSIKGAFYMAIDAKTQQVKVQQMSEFGSDFITQYYSEKEKKKEKKKEEKNGEEPELYQFRLDNLLIHEDGGVTLLAEQFFIDVRTYTTYDAQSHTTRTYSVYYYNYNDILVMSFDKTGMLTWKTKIPKRQTSVDDGGYYSSYVYSVVGDKIYFIYNDNPKNLFLPAGQKPEAFIRTKEVAVVLAEVNADGKLTRELLMTTEGNDLVIRPKMCEQTGEKEVLLLAEKSKSYQFSKVIFK